MFDPSSSKKDLAHPFEEFDENDENSKVLNKKGVLNLTVLY
jgi:hypothetical protein